MKKAISVILTAIIFLMLVSTGVSGYEIKDIKEPIFVTSDDGSYEYVIHGEAEGAYFYKSTEKNITVLNIPNSIDGKRIIGTYGAVVDSKSLVKINLPETIEVVLRNSFPPFTPYEETTPICSFNSNSNLKAFSYWAFNAKYQDENTYKMNEEYKILVFPKALEYMGVLALNRNTVDTIVFQNNPETELCAITVDSCAVGAEEIINRPCDVYFAENATNLSLRTFNYATPITDDVLGTGGDYVPSPSVIIHKNPGAEGFEKFVDEGYTVKEYTDEWWRDIKEIQSVTISGAGVTEKADSRALGTVTSLGWSESNDPAQYLSHEYELSMKSGEKVTLSSAFAPADAYDDRTFFVSLNEDVAAVDMETGELTALKKGAAKIRCVAASGVYSDCLLYVDGGTFADNLNENNGENTDNQSSDTSIGDIDNQSKSSFSNKAKTTLAALPSKPWFLPTAITVGVALLAAIIIPIARKKRRK